MTNGTTYWSRIGRWLIGAPDESPLQQSANSLRPPQRVEVHRSFFLRPFARRDAAIASLQNGFNALAELLAKIRDNLDRQSRRQDEMIAYLSHLPELLQSLPESQRHNAESLRIIGQQLQQQSQQQHRLAEVIEKVGAAHADHGILMENMNGRVEAVLENHDRVAQNLRQVSATMSALGQTSENGTQVLRQIQENLRRRDQDMDILLTRQNARLTALLLAALGGSLLAAVAAVVAILWHR